MERIIEFDRLQNVRDLGGLAGADGRTVRGGLLYRSDALSKLHGAGAEDLARFAKLGLHTVIDLRYPAEIEKYGRAPEAAGLAWFNLSIEHRPYSQVEEDPATTPARFFADRYAETVADGRAEIRTALELIADASNTPLAFHCKTGKDRTGIIAALVYHLLGVSRADIVADFALTERARARFIAEYEAEFGTGLPLQARAFRAPAAAMELFFAELERDYGSVDGYLAFTGVEADGLRTRLREAYLD